MQQSQPDSEQATYCYYSTFQLFEDNVDVKLLRKQRFVRKLLLFLGEEWKAYAGRSISFTLDNVHNFMNWQFCFDHLLILWLQEEFHNEEGMSTFLKEFQQKISLQSMQTDDVYFKPVCEGFYLSSIQIWEKSRMSRPPSSEALVDEVQQEDAPSTYSNRIIKPLTIVTTSIMNYISSVHGQHKTKQLITNNKQPISQEDQLASSISQLNLNDISSPQQGIKQKKLNKIGEKMLSQDIVQKAYSQVEHLFTQSHAKYQVVQQFVTGIVEVFTRPIRPQVNQNLIRTFTNRADQVNLRFLQPATGFYNDLIQLWVVFNVQNGQLKGQDFINKVRTSFGTKWNEKYLQPTLYFYNKVIELWAQIIADPSLFEKQEDQKVRLLVSMLRESLLQIWESEIVVKMFAYQRTQET